MFFVCIYTLCTYLMLNLQVSAQTAQIDKNLFSTEFHDNVQVTFSSAKLFWAIKFDTAINLSLYALLSLKTNYSNQLTTAFDLLVL